MVSRVTPFYVLVLLTAGCFHPLKTIDRITLDTPITGNFTLAMPPTVKSSPVVEMPVSGGGSKAKVAVVDVDGLLVNMNLTGLYSFGENPLGLFQEKMAAAAADPDVRAVVLRINSPGGGVVATDMMWRQVQAFRQKTNIPVVACLMDLGTGGAYYLATAANYIVASPNTITGGIGVIINLYNLVDAMAYFNIRYQPIKSGENIDMGAPTSTLSNEAKQVLNTMAQSYHQRFQQVVQQSRPRLDLTQPRLFDGRIFTAGQALQSGLIDQIGYLEDAIVAAQQMAHLDDARVVLFHRTNDPAHSPYDITPNTPLHTSLMPFSVPGLDRSRLPSFLYLWQPEPTMERLTGR